MSAVGRRVVDVVTGDLGTVCDSQGRLNRIDWDEPTPHQGEAWVQVPSRFIHYEPERQPCGTPKAPS